MLLAYIAISENIYCVSFLKLDSLELSLLPFTLNKAINSPEIKAPSYLLLISTFA